MKGYSRFLLFSGLDFLPPEERLGKAAHAQLQERKAERREWSKRASITDTALKLEERSIIE